MNEPATRIRRPATYQDVIDAPPHMVAELAHGALHLHPRPASRHALACFGMAARFDDPFRHGVGGPGGWYFAFEPELHLGPDVLVPDLGRRGGASGCRHSLTFAAPIWSRLGLRAVEPEHPQLRCDREARALRCERVARTVVRRSAREDAGGIRAPRGARGCWRRPSAARMRSAQCRSMRIEFPLSALGRIDGAGARRVLRRTVCPRFGGRRIGARAPLRRRSRSHGSISATPRRSEGPDGGACGSPGALRSGPSRRARGGRNGPRSLELRRLVPRGASRSRGAGARGRGALRRDRPGEQGEHARRLGGGGRSRCRGRRATCERRMSYRGDSDESWRRAAEFVAGDILRHCLP